MLARTGGGLRQQVRLDNSYERRLLSEVVSPEESGAGFCEVG